jgi:hypothetical protein
LSHDDRGQSSQDDLLASASSTSVAATTAAAASTTAATAAASARISAAKPCHILRGWTLLSLYDIELHAFAFVERLEAPASDRRMVDEQVLAAILGRDESEPLVVVEPLHCPFRTHRAVSIEKVGIAAG